jgi:hypothetical protein
MTPTAIGPEVQRITAQGLRQHLRAAHHQPTRPSASLASLLALHALVHAPILPR